MEGGFFLDVVVGESSAVFKLLSGENQSLLVRGDTFFVLDLGLDIVDGIAGFDLKSDCLTRKTEKIVSKFPQRVRVLQGLTS